MNLSDINTSKTAMKGFYDCVRLQLGNPDQLSERIKEAKEDKVLCEMIEPKNQAVQHEKPKAEPDQTPQPPKSEPPQPQPPKKSPPPKSVTFADEATKAKPTPGKMIQVRMSPEQHIQFTHELEVQKNWLVYNEKKRDAKLARKIWQKSAGLNKAYAEPESDTSD